jgi:hypothetical protein
MVGRLFRIDKHNRAPEELNLAVTLAKESGKFPVPVYE